MAQVTRFKKIHIKYFDRGANEQNDIVEDFVVHVIQHETDYINGVLFFDKINGENNLITYQEYIKQL